jgi:hypothetical protein
MAIHPVAGNFDKRTKTLELGCICEAAVFIYGIIFFKFEMNEQAVLFGESLLVVVAHQGCCHTSGIMVATVQTGLVDDAGLFEHLRLFFHHATAVAFTSQVKRCIAAEDTAADDEKVVCFDGLDGWNN